MDRLARHIETLVRKVADTRREAEAEQVTKSEDVIGKSSRIGVALLNPQLGFVIGQIVEDMRRIPHGGVDDLGVKRCVPVGDMSVEGDAGIVSILRVYLASPFAATARAVAPAVG